MSHRFLRIAVVYALLGMLIGSAMGISGNFADRDVHAHIGLLGWLSMAVMALCYRAWPALERSPLAVAHFWSYAIGVPVMLLGLLAIIHGRADLGEPVSGLGATGILAGMACFAINVWKYCDAGERRAHRSTMDSAIEAPR